jgi:hypothetical protein
MAQSKVFVVTGLDLGWDCIVGVFDAEKISVEELRVQFPEGRGMYMIFEQQVETTLANYD